MKSKRRAVTCFSSCWKGIKEALFEPKFYDCVETDDENISFRDQVFRLLFTNKGEVFDEDNAPQRFYSMEATHMDDIMDFRRSYMSKDQDGEVRVSSRKNSIQESYPWGTPFASGTGKNSWRAARATSFRVRGPSYLEDRLKVPSSSALTELVLFDMFESNTDIASAASSSDVGSVQRLRRCGETRRLLVLNFRIMPLQVVLVWALPPEGFNSSPATRLLNRFFSEDMDDAERKKRIKVIPRVVDGPWVVKKVVGETPGILGKKVPLEFFREDNLLEISVGVASSSAAKKICSVLKVAAAMIDVEVAVVLEGQHEEELPETVAAGFRVCFPDTNSFRVVN